VSVTRTAWELPVAECAGCSIRLQMMYSAIVTTKARLDDAAEMAKFLSPIPHADQLAKVLEDRKPISTRAYEDETQTARFVESDGNVVMCFTVADITIDQAEMIEAEWEGMCALDESAFQKAVEQALDASFDSAQ
jgi:hypothetical protein